MSKNLGTKLVGVEVDTVRQLVTFERVIADKVADALGVNLLGMHKVLRSQSTNAAPQQWPLRFWGEP